MKDNSCCFVGHNQCSVSLTIIDSIQQYINNLIVKCDVDVFYCGFYGQFDYMCANLVKQVQSVFPHVKLYAITPYILPSYNSHNEFFASMCDGVIYPALEYVPYKFAIAKRNDWMITNCHYVISCVNHSWGGAYRSLTKAISLGKVINNFGSYTY